MSSDQLPNFKPFPLNGLTYNQALGQAKLGMAISRAHWCEPTVIYHTGTPFLDTGEELLTWEPTSEDRGASDWCSRPAERTAA